MVDSLKDDRETLSTNTLSGLPVADRCQSWVGFRGFGPEGFSSALQSSASDHVNVIVSVEDTGAGIPLEAQSRIFMPFMQVRPSISRTHGGTGIGLSISKCLVHLMKGEIGFASVPKIGSTFSFTAVFTNGFCNTNDQRSHQINKPSSSIPLDFQGMRALVVDFRTVRVEASRYHLQRLGIHVEVVADLELAFSCISNPDTTVNMVLIEQEVWDRDFGLSDHFMHKLRGIDHSGPKVFLLANSVKCAQVSLSASGVSTPSVITKPLRASMLAASLQRAMGVGGSYRNGELSSVTLCNLLRGRKILVVDDNKVNLKVAEGFLKMYGAEVVCAERGRKAVSLLQPPHQFDACFMDIQMPEMDG